MTIKKMIKDIMEMHFDENHVEPKFPAHLRPSKIEHHIALKTSLYAWIVSRYMQQKVDIDLFSTMKKRLVEWLNHNGFKEEDLTSRMDRVVTRKDIAKALDICRFDDNLFRGGDIDTITKYYDDYDVKELQDFEDLKFAFCEGWGIENMIDKNELAYRAAFVHAPIFAKTNKKVLHRAEIKTNDIHPHA